MIGASEPFMMRSIPLRNGKVWPDTADLALGEDAHHLSRSSIHFVGRR